jgi:hypothetical protein
VHRGLEVGLHLRPGMPEENFVAEALGNLAAFELKRRRAEVILWQVVRVELPNSHHYRLVLRHPDRVLDPGFARDVKAVLDLLSDESVDQLKVRFASAQREGLVPMKLRHVQEDVDFWRDDFWSWFG